MLSEKQKLQLLSEYGFDMKSILKAKTEVSPKYKFTNVHVMEDVYFTEVQYSDDLKFIKKLITIISNEIAEQRLKDFKKEIRFLFEINPS